MARLDHNRLFDRAIAVIKAGDTNIGPLSGNTVCAESTSNKVWLGSTTAGGRDNCQTSETVTLGKIAGGTITGAARFSASYAWGNANKTLTATLGPRTNSTENPTLGHGDWTFNPASDVTNFRDRRYLRTVVGCCGHRVPSQLFF